MDGIEVHRVWSYLAANKGIVKRMLNYISYMFSGTLASLRIDRPDVVVATTPQFFCGFAGLIVAGLRRRAFVLEVRDMWADSMEATGALARGRALRLLDRIETALYSHVPRIVAVGDGYRSDLIRKGVDPERVSVVVNGADLEFYRPRAPDPELRRAWGLEGRFVCAYVGTIGMACGLDVVLRAAAKLRDANPHQIAFLLVGDGAERERLEAQAKAEGLSQVIFAGQQPKSTIPGFLALADVALAHLKRRRLYRTVLPSKMFEAMAMERPVILGVEGSAAEVLERAGGGICIEPENAVELLDALERFAEDPELRRRQASAGRRHVERHFDRDNLARDYADLLRQEVIRGAKPDSD